MNYMVHVSSTLWRIKNQPSNYTSCSDQCPTLVGSCGGQIILMTSSDVFISIWGCVLKGCFERGMFWAKGQIAFEGHWRLQSWTLVEGLVQIQDVN